MRILAISRTTDAATPEALNASMDAEVAQGRQFFEDGFIREGYMDPSYTTAYMLLESPSLEEARATLARYPDTQAGLNTWDLFPLIGLPAIAQSLEARALPLPAWWPEGGDTQTDEQATNASIARRFVEEVLAQGNMQTFDELVDDNIVVNSGISPFAPMVGKEAFRQGLGALAAFSNGTMTIEDLLAVDDRVVVRYRAVANHTGDQLGVPPTGKRITMWEIRLMRLRDGRIVEDFVADINYDWPWLIASAYPDGVGRTGGA